MLDEKPRRSGSTRLEQGRRAARKEFAEVQAGLTEFLKTDLVRFAPAEQVNALHTCVRELEIVINETILEERARATLVDVQSLRENLRSLIAQVNAAKLCEALAGEEAELTRLEHQVAALDRARSDKFDRNGASNLARLLADARSNLQRQDVPQVRRDIAAVRQLLVNHEAEVTKKFVAWQAARDRSEMALEAASDRIAGLRADEIIVRWGSGEIASLEGRVERSRKLLSEERFDVVLAESSDLLEASDAVVGHVQELQLKEERRQYIVQGIVEMMGQMGFVVQQNSLALEHPDVPSSATMIHAVRIGGGAIAVSVPQDGEILYDVDGFPKRTETGGDGATVRTCDEAEQEIDRIHEAMKDAFGIEMSELVWEGKDPDRVRKAAERLPGSAPAERVRGE
ncbi:MAG: hypothetical protein K2X38_22980 [Gemmataceae bacterium]|nr:hypothetical protein [Gemmataceae bacterium]